MNKQKWICFLVFITMMVAACSGVKSGPKGAEQGTAQPTERVDIALEWSREGGIAGFCDQLLISTGGEAVVSNCKSGDTVESGRTNLKADQLTLLSEDLEKFKEFDWEQSDPASADAMTIKMHFYGKGSVEATQADKQALLDLAESVVSTIK